MMTLIRLGERSRGFGDRHITEAGAPIELVILSFAQSTLGHISPFVFGDHLHHM